MKTIYMIYEENWGHTGVTFTNKKSAEKFVEFQNEAYNSLYYIKPKKLYENLEEYVKNNKSKTKEDIKRAIEKLTSDSLFDCFWLKFKNGNKGLTYNQMKKIVENNKFDFTSWYGSNDKVCRVVKSDLQVVINKYEEINNKIKNYKDMLKALENKENSEKSF